MAFKLKPLKSVVESMTEVEIVSGYPTMQLDSKNGWFECPVEAEGLTQKKLAEKYKCSIGTIKRRLSKNEERNN